jgi:hypothetical protein
MSMHIHIIPNRTSPPTVLLRQSYREGSKVKKRTIGNLSDLPMDQVELIRLVLRGVDLMPASGAWEIVASRAHGAVEAVLAAMKRLGFAGLVAAGPSRERDLVLAMVAARIVSPQTKLATVRWWQGSTLAEELGVADAGEDDLYAAMDWLLGQQAAIETRLAKRHLSEGGLVLYDLSSSYVEGACCPLARRGYSRDGKKGTLQVNYGLMTNAQGCPVAIGVHAGNTADPVTLMPEVERVRAQFGLADMVLVGDRGLISHKAIGAFKEQGGIDWISALKTGTIRGLVEAGALQPDLFDERNLFELSHPEYPGERLIACRNPELGRRRAYKREDMLAVTEGELDAIAARVAAGRLRGADKIGLAVGKVIDRRKMAKHLILSITEDRFTYARDTAAIAREAALDGLYIIRTSLAAERMDAAQCVRSYKSLTRVERAFRAIKTVDLKVRPIHHRLADRVRAHIFLCMLAYYVEWHMREAWAELLFADEETEAKDTRDPVAPATRSDSAQAKIAARTTTSGYPVHSFQTLLANLATITRNTCRVPGQGLPGPTFDVLTTPTKLQEHALQLIHSIQP